MSTNTKPVVKTFMRITENRFNEATVEMLINAAVRRVTENPEVVALASHLGEEEFRASPAFRIALMLAFAQAAEEIEQIAEAINEDVNRDPEHWERITRNHLELVSA